MLASRAKGRRRRADERRDGGRRRRANTGSPASADTQVDGRYVSYTSVTHTHTTMRVCAPPAPEVAAAQMGLVEWKISAVRSDHFSPHASGSRTHASPLTLCLSLVGRRVPEGLLQIAEKYQVGPRRSAHSSSSSSAAAKRACASRRASSDARPLGLRREDGCRGTQVNARWEKKG